MVTTAACPAFAHLAEADATVVRRLVEAGAMLMGKTNLDQFATGLVGTRSPYGVPANPFDGAYIPGGSSSGSAVAVARGLVSFALGTDTAGSGRVPAAFNNLVGLKPTRGLVSTAGVVPACRSLDCVSVFAMTAADAAAVLAVAAAPDAGDAFSRARPAAGVPRLPDSALVAGVPRPDQLEFFGDPETPGLFAGAIARLRDIGVQVREIDAGAFLDAARLLYGGPWVAERYWAVKALIEESPEALHPVTRQVIEAARGYSAVDAFDAFYRLQALRAEAERTWAGIDVLVMPTAPTIYTRAALDADPVRLNSNLGTYTNFMNLLDLAAVAVPAGFTGHGLPFGITFAAPAFTDADLLALGGRFHAATGLALATGRTPAPAAPPAAGGPNGRFALAVCGAHLDGEPLNGQLTARGGVLLRRTRTAPVYRMVALNGPGPERPGLLRAPTGADIEVEVWEIDAAQVGGFVTEIAPPLGLGTVALEDGSTVPGFLCEAYAARDAEDITEYGGWRAYRAPSRPTPPPSHPRGGTT